MSYCWESKGAFNCVSIFALKSYCVCELTILPFVLAGMAFTAVFCVKGFFVSENGMKYKGGVTHVMEGLDDDKWSFFEIEGIVKELDKDPRSFRIWWKLTTISLDAGLIKIGDDEDASIISKYAVEHNAKVEIYVEYITEVNATANYPVCLDHEKPVKDKKKTAMVWQFQHMNLVLMLIIKLVVILMIVSIQDWMIVKRRGS